MRLPELPWNGGCRCGKVRFQVTRPPLATMACHCRGCQLMTGSAFSTTLILPLDGFAITAGDPVRGGLHGDDARHHHCDWCKGWVFTGVPPEYGMVNVRATLLDDPSWYEPFVETQRAEMLPWAATGAPRRYERFPEPADFAGLMRDFVASLQ